MKRVIASSITEYRWPDGLSCIKKNNECKLRHAKICPNFLNNSCGFVNRRVQVILFLYFIKTYMINIDLTTENHTNEFIPILDQNNKNSPRATLSPVFSISSSSRSDTPLNTPLVGSALSNTNQYSMECNFNFRIYVARFIKAMPTNNTEFIELETSWG